MTQWIIVALLYSAGFGLLAALGGLAAAGDAIRQWSQRNIRIERPGGHDVETATTAGRIRSEDEYRCVPEELMS